jgi:hypothetical protein
MITSTVMTFISIHWGFATGCLLAHNSNWSIPRFLIIILLFKYILLNYET